jgi:hypothetical protein
MSSFKAGRKEPKTVLYTEKRLPGQSSQIHNASTSSAISHPSVIVNNFVSGEMSESGREIFAGSPDLRIRRSETEPETSGIPINTIPEGLNSEPLENAEEKPDTAKMERLDETPTIEPKADTSFKVSPPGPRRSVKITDEEFEQNPRLRICREVEVAPPEFIIDVSFLRHVITTILTRYNITLANKDIQGILAYWGDVTIETRRQVIKERTAGEPGCCGISEKEIEKIVETIKKLYIEGVNVIKHVPALIKFLSDIGINI